MLALRTLEDTRVEMWVASWIIKGGRILAGMGHHAFAQVVAESAATDENHWRRLDPLEDAAIEGPFKVGDVIDKDFRLVHLPASQKRGGDTEFLFEAALQKPLHHIGGGDALVLKMDGDFKGAMGQPPLPGARMLAVMLVRPGESLFVKMLGPQGVMDGEEANFYALCDSLKEES